MPSWRKSPPRGRDDPDRQPLSVRLVVIPCAACRLLTLDGGGSFDGLVAQVAALTGWLPETIKLIPGHGPVFALRPDMLPKARQRLAAFVSDPLRHARHAVKVLLKFRLLEVQRQPLAQFTQWASATPYFELIRQRFFAGMPLTLWISQLCTELVSAGVARQDGADLVNA